MADVEIITRPKISTEAEDAGVVARVSNLARLIHEHPATFMHSCRAFGSAALKHMADNPNGIDAEAINETDAAIAVSLQERDVAEIIFDADSEKAIYGSPNLKTVITSMGPARGEQVTGLRNTVGAYTLYLFAERSQQWNQQQAIQSAAQNGAA